VSGSTAGRWLRVVALLAATLVIAGFLAGRATTHRTAGKPTPEAHAESVVYQNPVIAGDFPDPSIVVDGRRYLAVGSGSGGRNVQMAVSRDLAHWRVVGDVLPQLPSWAVVDSTLVWAPTLERVGDHWVLWFTARDRASQRQCIGWASADVAAGPFRSDATTPAVCQPSLGGSIDPEVFIDSDRSRWLLWKNDGNCCGIASNIWSAPLADDGTTLVGIPTAILAYSGGWQSAANPYRSTVEAPSMLRAKGTYHLFVSGNDFATTRYAVGEALCDAPSGPCRYVSLYPNLASYADVAGPGGGSTFRDRGGRWWFVYAAWTSPAIGYENNGVRSMRIDRLVIRGSVATIVGPTTTPVGASIGRRQRP
jgi:beta-xylosidase